MSECCSHSASVPAGHPNMGGPMRMNPPRGMAMGPQVCPVNGPQT